MEKSKEMKFIMGFVTNSSSYSSTTINIKNKKLVELIIDYRLEYDLFVGADVHFAENEINVVFEEDGPLAVPKSTTEIVELLYLFSSDKPEDSVLLANKETINNDYEYVHWEVSFSTNGFENEDEINQVWETYFRNKGEFPVDFKMLQKNTIFNFRIPKYEFKEKFIIETSSKKYTYRSYEENIFDRLMSVMVKFDEYTKYQYNTQLPLQIGDKVLVQGRLSKRMGEVIKINLPWKKEIYMKDVVFVVPNYEEEEINNESDDPNQNALYEVVKVVPIVNSLSEVLILTYATGDFKLEVGDLVSCDDGAFANKGLMVIRGNHFVSANNLGFDPSKLLSISKIIRKNKTVDDILM